MRRTTALVLGTATGAALLVGAKFGNTSLAAGVDSSGVVVAAGPDSPPTEPAPTRPGPTVATGSAPGSAPAHATSAPASAKGSTKPRPTSTPTKAAPKPTPSGPTDGTYSATATVPHGRGTLSMTVTISGHKITKIAASEASPTETNCWNDACPKLTSEALSAQSASVAAVSRATYTSTAYKAALASILAKANG